MKENCGFIKIKKKNIIIKLTRTNISDLEKTKDIRVILCQVVGKNYFLFTQTNLPPRYNLLYGSEYTVPSIL